MGKIVLRNTTSRKDAVYIIDVDEQSCKVDAYWGRWEVYCAKDSGGLQGQTKTNIYNTEHWTPIALKLLQQKLGKGYVPVDMYGDLLWAKPILDRYGYELGASTPASQPRDLAQPEPTPERPRSRTRAAMLEL